MTFTTECIQQVLIEKITGTIDVDDDDIVIRKLLMENEDVLYL